MNKWDLETNIDALSGEDNKKFKFDPPLYLQRYQYVMDLLKENKCKTYMDIGCAECNLLRYAKNSTDLNLNLIIGVDVDDEVLSNAEHKFTLLYDLVQQRESPLDIYLINGDIGIPSDYFLEKVSYQNMTLDFVSLVEVIEHMYPETLQNAINSIFGKIKPRMIVMTTPNSEFNVVFEDEEENSQIENKDATLKTQKKFRHWDHKFEWTRKEFENWCQNDILDIYEDYSLVKFDGLGEPPNGYEHCGFCTQIAIFVRNDNFKQNLSTFQNKFEIYLKEKKNLYLKNREIQFERSKPELKLTQEPYFSRDSFEKFYELESVSREFKLVFSMSYPFENFEFENEIDRKNALLREIDNTIKFLTASYKGFGCYNDIVMSEEENEKLENNLDVEDNTIRLASISKILEFPILKKFKYSNEKILEVMKENNYIFTLNKKYVVFKIEENGSEYSNESQTNDEICDRGDYFQSKDHLDEEEWK